MYEDDDDDEEMVGSLEGDLPSDILIGLLILLGSVLLLVVAAIGLFLYCVL